ncbi:hypothetical protein WN944_021540 [Citrus x changshan-huyou]|uniref:Uncharacterized protein n=1 Tax=Citrus x changshan-huyou TaxID=2935761 RepID=A0AAP0MX33_9ROSI
MAGNGELEETNVPLLEDLASKVPKTLDDSDQNLPRRVWIESKKLWYIVGPTIFSRLVSYAMLAITLAFAGHLGDLELAAISIVNNVVIGFDFGLLLLGQPTTDVAEMFAVVCWWMITTSLQLCLSISSREIFAMPA